MNDTDHREAGTGLYFGNRIPFLQHIGVEAGELDVDTASARLTFDPDLANSAGYAHGGSVMSALDFAMSAAARGSDVGGLAPSTIEMKTSFIRPVKSHVEISARCIHRGRSIAFCEAVAHDAEGNLVASASSVFKLNSRTERRPGA